MHKQRFIFANSFVAGFTDINIAQASIVKEDCRSLQNNRKRRRIMEEKKNPIAKKKTEGIQKDEKKKNTLNKPSLLCEQSAALRMEDGDAE